MSWTSASWRCSPARGEPRPTVLRSHGDHAVGAFVVPVAVKDEDRVYYQEVDLVLSRERALTVRRTPEDGEPFDPTELKEACEDRDVPPARSPFTWPTSSPSATST